MEILAYREKILCNQGFDCCSAMAVCGYSSALNKNPNHIQVIKLKFCLEYTFYMNMYVWGENSAGKTEFICSVFEYQ